MDAFYASVEQRDFPELRGKPIIVGGTSRQRGVVATASYEARKFGIRSAMPTAKAVKLCPSVILQKARFSVYKDVSDQIRNIFYEYTDLVEPMSLDEAYLDVSSHPLPATQIASEIKEKIKQQTGLTASAGVAPSKMVAKIASDMQKPNGLTVVAPERVFTFMQPLALKKIPGIGPVTNSRLADQGYIFCHDIISEDAKILERKFGQKQAQWLIRKAQGIDRSVICRGRERKSVGHERTYSDDIIDREIIDQSLENLIAQGIERLRKTQLLAKTINLKVKYHDFSVSNRSLTLEHPTCDEGITHEAITILLKKTKVGKKAVRLLGVSFSNLSRHDGIVKKGIQKPLFPMEMH